MVTFSIAGEGRLRPVLEAMIEEAGLRGKFLLHGAVGDIPGFLATLRIAVLSSRAEGMPNAILEYMAAGRPIVAAAVGGVGDLIEDGKEGLLVPAEDPERLAAACMRLIDQTDFAARLGSNARLRVQREFGREAVARRFESFYMQLDGRAVL
jgi:glycosyltransferase involved in cell wall biosynthesis